MDTLPADNGRRRFVQGVAALGGSLLACSSTGMVAMAYRKSLWL